MQLGTKFLPLLLLLLTPTISTSSSSSLLPFPLSLPLPLLPRLRLDVCDAGGDLFPVLLLPWVLDLDLVVRARFDLRDVAFSLANTDGNIADGDDAAVDDDGPDGLRDLEFSSADADADGEDAAAGAREEEFKFAIAAADADGLAVACNRLDDRRSPLGLPFAILLLLSRPATGWLQC